MQGTFDMVEKLLSKTRNILKIICICFKDSSNVYAVKPRLSGHFRSRKYFLFNEVFRIIEYKYCNIVEFCSRPFSSG